MCLTLYQNPNMNYEPLLPYKRADFSVIIPQENLAFGSKKPHSTPVPESLYLQTFSGVQREKQQEISAVTFVILNNNWRFFFRIYKEFL